MFTFIQGNIVMNVVQLNIKLRRFSGFSSKKTFFYIIRIKAWIRFYVERCNNKAEPAIRSEAVVWRCYVKKVFLKISQNSQENT